MAAAGQRRGVRPTAQGDVVAPHLQLAGQRIVDRLVAVRLAGRIGRREAGAQGRDVAGVLVDLDRRRILPDAVAVAAFGPRGRRGEQIQSRARAAGVGRRPLVDQG